MSNSTTFSRRKSKAAIRYCENCWRDERHVPINKNLPLIILYTVLTLGIYLCVRGVRCQCCGTKRQNLD